MTAPEERAVAAFRAAFGTEPALLWQAPGRVNLIGEHTDYNDGFVLPCAIDRRTAIAVGPGADRIEVVAADAGERDAFAPALPLAHAGGWRDYVRGVAAELLAAGVAVPPLRLAIAGDVPLGAGLSSSAALEVAVALALRNPPPFTGEVPSDREAVGARAAHWPPPTRSAGHLPRTAGEDQQAQIALLCQRAENRFVGCQCGIMDQLVSAAAVARHALLIDCRSLERMPVRLPDGCAVMVIDSGVRHAHTGSGYNDRRAECERAAAHYGVATLRDLDAAALDAGRAGLDDLAFRRARHVVTENARVLAAADALAAGDLASTGRLMAESHASMRDDFAITTPEIDRIVGVAQAAIGGEGGARMTGGGFGGSVVALAPAALVGAVRAGVAQGCRTPAGAPPSVAVFAAAGGAGQVRFTPGTL